MTDPVMCTDGHTYERVNIQAWFHRSNLNPNTGTVLPNKTLISNFALTNAVDEFVSNS
jgi:hypothetical protein